MCVSEVSERERLFLKNMRERVCVRKRERLCVISMSERVCDKERKVVY